MIATSGRARIAYDVSGGSEDGVDVLLFHAGVTDRRSWAAVVESLGLRHRCVSFDARTFGETTYEPQTGWSHADDAVAVLDAAGVGSAVFVACSMGGATALDVALDHTERCSALVLIGTAIRGAPYPEITVGPAAALEAQTEAAEEAEDLDEVNRLEAWTWLDGPAAPEGRVGGEARELFLDMNGKALRAPDPGPRAEQVDTWPRLGDVTVPTLVLVGSLDMPDIQAVDEEAAGVIPGARLVRLDGVAHLPQMEADTTFLREIGDFVDRVATS
jgi:pimeloyl-ACP methyl ester carboxylesterase